MTDRHCAVICVVVITALLIAVDINAHGFVWSMVQGMRQ